MKFLGILLSMAFSAPAFAVTTLTCTWADSDHGNPVFQIDVDSNQNTASAKLIDGISPGTPAKYDCQIQPSCSAELISVRTLLCMGPQLAPDAGQLLTTFIVDLANKKAAIQNTLVQPSGLTTLSSFASTQCK